jgi:hypothetical protein
MDRRWIVRVLGTGLVTLPFVNRKAAAYEKSPEKHHKLAIHVDVNDPEVMKLAFNNARNAHELYTEWGEDVAIEIVAYSQGLHMLNDGVQQQTQRVYENVALLALDLLARIIAMRIDPGPPFSALFTLWLSMIAAVGLASRSLFSRHAA